MPRSMPAATRILTAVAFLASPALLRAGEEMLDGPLPTPPNVEDLIPREEPEPEAEPAPAEEPGGFPADPGPPTPTAEPEEEPEAEPAPAPTTTDADEAGYEAPMPFTGGGVRGVVVDAANVNMRAGPGADENDVAYEIVKTVPRGTEVTILAERGGWYAIAYPQGESVWIKNDALEGDPPATIPPDGVAMPVRENGATLRVRAWDGATAVGRLEGNDIVRVTGRRGTYYRIEAPAAARAWISAKYVKLEEPRDLPTAQAPEPGQGATVGQRPARRDGDEEEAETEEPTPARSEIFDLIVRRRKTEQPDPEAEARRREAERQRYLARVEAELEAIRARTEERKAAIAARYGKSPAAAPPRPAPGRMTETPPAAAAEEAETEFTGWIEFIGHGLGRPAAYRLVKGGEILFLLRSATFDLARYVNDRVALGGRVELAPGYQANVLVVDELRLLDEDPVDRRRALPPAPGPAPRPGPGAGRLEEAAEEPAPIPPPPAGEAGPATDEGMMDASLNGGDEAEAAPPAEEGVVIVETEEEPAEGSLLPAE